jgi:hypothetical protein
MKISSLTMLCSAVRGVVMGSVLIASEVALAMSQGTPITGLSAASLYSERVKITAFDPAARTVSLAFTDGRTGTYKASEAVRNLDQLSVGDTVEGAYEEQLSFVLSGPNAVTPHDRGIVAAARAAPGQAPGGAIGCEIVLSWTVVRTDVPGSTIARVKPDGGQARIFDVRTPEGRAQLAQVKPGDRLMAISTELLAVAVAPKR